jgi:hypothetical protein
MRTISFYLNKIGLKYSVLLADDDGLIAIFLWWFGLKLKENGRELSGGRLVLNSRGRWRLTLKFLTPSICSNFLVSHVGDTITNCYYYCFTIYPYLY